MAGRACLRFAGDAPRRAGVAPADGAVGDPRGARDLALARARRRTGGDAQALARGRIVHRLLQALPALPPEHRAEAARRSLARQKVSAEEGDGNSARGASTLLDDARFAALFAPGSRAEVPIVGVLFHDGRRVSGQVDRLAVTATDVLIADYKIEPNRAAAGIEDIPRGLHRATGALPRRAARASIRITAIRAALIWTAGPALTELPDARSTPQCQGFRP